MPASMRATSWQIFKEQCLRAQKRRRPLSVSRGGLSLRVTRVMEEPPLRTELLIACEPLRFDEGRQNARRPSNSHLGAPG